MTLHSSISENSGDNTGKVTSLNGMVFIGDSILNRLANKDSTLKNEGAKILYRGGCDAKYFLGKSTSSGKSNSCIEKNGYFDWEANFKDVKNPTGFYLVLGQNFYEKSDRIQQMDDLVKKIKSQYPTPPIFISSVLHNLKSSDSNEKVDKMNSELRTYCSTHDKVFYSYILKGYKDNLKEMVDDTVHPNEKGASLLVKNIKENIIGSNSSSTTSTTSTTNTSTKATSLKGMVFMGDSILSALRGRTSLEKDEGAITMYQSGCNVEFFLGEQDCSFNSDTNCRDGGYFNWDKQFSNITNPTGFYLMLGQNFFEDKDHRIERMDRLVQKIRSQYPNAPIYISSVLRYIKRNDPNRTRQVKEATLSMNEELKAYCLKNSGNNVFYSDVLKGYDESDEMLISHTVDDDHPNEEGAKIILNNIKANLVSKNYIDISNDEEVLKITAIDYKSVSNDGWGDGIMLSSNGYNLLMDTFSSLCKESLYKFLRDNSITSFDIYISHNHGDHHGNLMSLVNDYNVSKVYLPNLSSFDKSAKDIEAKGITVIRLKEGSKFEIGSSNCVAEVLFGPKTFEECKNDSGKYINNQSLVTMIKTKTKIGDVKYLTGGDIEELAANEILERGIDIQADIMKADHHGGGDTPSYVKKVNPSFYIIDLCREYQYDNWVKPQVDAAEECGNVFSTMYNGEISFSIKSSGNIVPNAQRNVEQVEFNVQDDSGNIYTVTYTLNKDSSHILTDRMKAAVTNTTTGSTLKSTYKVKVATWSENLDKVESDDPSVTEYNTGFQPNMTTTTIPYQEIVSKYKMPFNYLWTMLVYSQDKDYVFDLAELVDNSKIVITIHDNYTETKNIVTDRYTYYKKESTTAKADVSYRYKYTDSFKTVNPSTGMPETYYFDNEANGSENGKDVSAVSDYYDPKKGETYYKTNTKINRNNTLDIALTLADSWFVKYTKEYNFNRLKESPPYENTQSLPDIENDPEYVNDVGGNKQKLINQAIEKINQSGIVGEPSVKIYNAKTEIINRIINRSMETTNIVSSSSYVASVPGSSGSGSSGYSSSVSNVSTGDINSDSLELVPEVQGDGNNHQQGFCFAGDDLIVYATVYGTGSSEVCSLYLADANTMKLLDSIKGGLSGHGNSIAYDSKTGEVIFPETGVMKLIPVNKTTKTFDKNNIREQALPEYARNTPSIAYNENKDLFICKENVYTREAFYSNGKPLKKMNFKEPLSNLDYSGATAFGNQVYYFYCDPRDRYAHGNYVVICNLDTGNQEETLYDSTPREGEEISFTRDGTLYICYGYGRANGKRGSVGTSFNKTDYSYINDNNIDKSNVTIGSSATANDIARYNTGGEYDKKSGFAKVVKVFNSHYNARSNILSVTEWLFEALEQNQDTEKMVDLTQYLLHKATGNNYGEYGTKEFDYEAYDPGQFNSVTSGIYGNTPQEKVWFALRAAGFSEYAVAGAMGNIEAESGFRQDTIEGGSGAGFGLCQWSFGRRDRLEQYAKSKGKPASDIEIQIEYLIGELTPGGGADGYAKFNFSSNYENWKNATSVEQATELYCRYFERPRMDVAHMDRRKTAANKYYNEFHGKTAPSGIQTGDFTQYYQTDYSNVSYGSGSIASCGCGPTSFAMVASTLLKKQITPADAVSWCGNKYYVSGQGTSWSYFNAASEHFGLSKPRNVNSIDEVTNALKSGKLVISSQNRGIFTNSGHFIVLSGISSDGKISVKDPNKNNAINKGYNDRLFSTQEINSAAASYWIF